MLICFLGRIGCDGRRCVVAMGEPWLGDQRLRGGGGDEWILLIKRGRTDEFGSSSPGASVICMVMPSLLTGASSGRDFCEYDRGLRRTDA
jgi:hypothetical protein